MNDWFVIVWRWRKRVLGETWLPMPVAVGIAATLVVVVLWAALR